VTAHGGRAFLRNRVPNNLERCGSAVLQDIVVILREIASARFVAPIGLPGIRLQIARCDLEQRRLAEPVRADDGNALAAPHGE
jgi:hypothetical protein